MSVLLDEGLVAKIKGIQFRAKHLVNSTFAGEYQSAFKGRGMEFDEVREYQPGDDVRNIDWNVTARTDSAFVKVFKDERELTVVFVVDVSASSHFGTTKKFKNEVAAEISALLAYMALRSNDKVGLIIFSDHVEHYVPPKKGRGHIWRLIRDILTYKSQARKTDLQVPLEFLNQIIKHKAIVFLISDFQGEDFDQQVQVTSKRHELIAVSVNDPREKELPNIGYVELEDAETGQAILINTSSKKLREGYKKESARRLKEQQKFFRNNGIDYIEVDTRDTYVDALVSFFRTRDRRVRV